MTQDYARGISEENRPGLKYLVIPIEVLCNKKLSYTDKVIFAIVDLFDNKNHCYATNEYLARVLEVSSQTVSNSINVLIDHEYLEKIGFDGRRRILAVNQKYKQKYKILTDKLHERLYGSYDAEYKEVNIQDITDFVTNNISNKNKKNVCNKLHKAESNSAQPSLSKISPRRKKQINIVFDYWNGLGKPLCRHKKTSKIGQRSLLMIANKLNNGTSPELLMDAMKKYHTILTSPGTKLNNGVGGHKVTLAEFFQFDRYTKGLIDKQKRSVISNVVSWFDECKEKSQEELLEKFTKIKPLQDNYPTLTTKISKMYGKEILRTKKPIYSQNQKNGFIKCSEKIVKLQNKIQKEYDAVVALNELVECMFECLIKAFGENIGIGNLVSDYTFNDLLPRWLNDQAIMQWVESGIDFDFEDAESTSLH
jgi:DNA-binding MarR family transcriptional regulator